MSFPGKMRDMQEVRCCICHSIINDVNGVYQSPSFYSVACQKCFKEFSGDDLEMMISLFYIYGGYFGKKSEEKFCLESILDTIGDEIPIDFDNLNTINQRVMHTALLHGLKPSEFNNLLKRYIER